MVVVMQEEVCIAWLKVERDPIEFSFVCYVV